MRLKTKLVLAITGLVFSVVLVFSWIWLSQLLQQHIEQSWLTTDYLAHNVLFQMRQALDSGLRDRQFDPNDPVAVRAAVADSLRRDAGLNALLTSIVNYSPTVLDVSIVDRQNRAIIAVPDSTLDDQVLPSRPDYSVLRRQSPVRTLKVVFGKPQVYNVSLGLDRNNQPFLTIRIGIRTTFLGSAFKPWLIESFSFMGLAMIISMIVAAFVANLALQPIEQISQRLDALAPQEALAEAAAARGSRHSMEPEMPPGAAASGRCRNGNPGAAVTPWPRFPARSNASASASATWRKSSPPCARISIRSSPTCRTA